MNATTRVVRPDDLDVRLSYDLWRLRQQVFVVEQGSPYPDLDGRDLEPATRHVLLEEAGTLVGCLRLLDEGDAWRIGRVVVAASARGRGLARLLMDEAVALCRAEGGIAREVRLDAQTGLTAFYGAYGFEVSGPEFVEDGIPHTPMRRG